MKTKLVILALLICPAVANALCSGGFDGPKGKDFGCSELGGLGDLLYERDATGAVVNKRTDAQIKAYVVDFVKDRFKNHGVVLSEKDVKVGDKTVDFDLFNQNGDKVYFYSLNKETGVSANEKELFDHRAQVDATRKTERGVLLDNIKRLKQLRAELESGGEK